VAFLRRLSTEDTRKLIEAAQAGSDEARNRLVAALEPLVVRMATRVLGRHLQRGRDEEISVALMALNEAITSFDPSRGRNFVGFAEQVIRRRLVDHYRRQPRTEVVLSTLEREDEDGHTFVPALAKEALERSRADVEADARREEIAVYRLRLKEFGLTLDELARNSPRHEDSRRGAMAVALLLARDPLLRDYLLTRRVLPLKALTDRVAVSRKTLERQRKYIIAVALVVCGEFPHLREYIRDRLDDIS
jgi:RNA polymerase sigma factor